jgi:hypothetical protein
MNSNEEIATSQLKMTRIKNAAYQSRKLKMQLIQQVRMNGIQNSDGKKYN